MAEYNPDTDPRSSNNLIRAYLASKGIQPNMPGYAQSVRTALEANANPNTRGTIPGLVNSTPSTEADDQAAMAARSALRGSGGGGQVTRLHCRHRRHLRNSKRCLTHYRLMMRAVIATLHCKSCAVSGLAWVVLC